MLIGLDIATKTGVAFIPSLESPSVGARAETWRVQGGMGEPQIAAIDLSKQLARTFRKLKAEGTPATAVMIEMPRHATLHVRQVEAKDLVGGKVAAPAGNPKVTSYLWCLQGAAVAVASAFCNDVRYLPPDGWRTPVLGKNPAGGRWTKQAAKAAAKEYCRKLKIDVRNVDEAEAMCIALKLHADLKLRSRAAA